jgi:hypothetical protein
VEDTNVTDGNALTDKVKINLNMLDALVLNWVGGELDDADIVAVDQSGPRQGVVQLHKQLSKRVQRRRESSDATSGQGGEDPTARRSS